MQNNLEEKQRKLIEENINISAGNPIAELFKYLFAFLLIILLLYLFADFLSNVCIVFMPYKTQQKIENLISKTNKYQKKEEIHKYDNIKNRIISYDSNLYQKKDFPIYKDSSEEINAYVVPDGSIFLTEGLLKNVKDEEMMAFVLAHEIGHYVHRDHLKSLGRGVMVLIFSSVLSSSGGDVSEVASSIHDVAGITYSKAQETNADKYAARVVKKIYGNTNGAIEFFKMLDEKSKYPEFLEYISSHPSTKSRIKRLERLK